MNNRIESALAWKEIRQSAPIVIAFIVMTAIVTGNLWYLHHYSHQRFVHYTIPQIQEWMHYYAFFISLGLGYLLACGNRLLEANEQVEAFLFVRPVERSMMIRVYYLVGLVGFLAWLAAFTLMLWLLFGAEVFSSTGRFMNLYEFHYAAFFLALLISHAITFTIALAGPSLVGTSTAFIGSYIAILAIAQFRADMLTKEFLQNSVYALVFLAGLLVLAAAVGGTIFLYQRKEVK